MNLEGKVVVITGGGNGIGRELVLQSLAKGARVAAVDLREASLSELPPLAADAADRLSTHVADVVDRGRVQSLPEEVVAAHGAVDVLINNAGIIQPFVRIAELDHETIDRVIDVNLHGTLNMVKAFLPLLLERPEAHIANLSSMGAFLPVPGQSIYCATKAAVRLMTEGLYAELLETSVGVSVIMPGAIGTDITTNSGVAAPDVDASGHHTTSPSAAASDILRCIEKGRLHAYPGRDSKIVSVAMRIAPMAALHAVQKRMKVLLDAGPKRLAQSAAEKLG